MASEKNQRVGEAFKRMMEKDRSIREACERLGERLTLLAPILKQAGTETRDELRQRQLEEIDPFSHDGLIQLAFFAGVDDPESRTQGEIVDAVLEWADKKRLEFERDKYLRKIQQSVESGSGDDGSGDLPVEEPSAAYRYGESPDGELLTATFLEGRFGMSQPFLSKQQKDLAGRRKHGRGFVYLWKEVLALSEKKNVNMK